MIKEIGIIDYENPVIRSFYGIKEKFVDFLKENCLMLCVNTDNNEVIVYDKNGNDKEIITLKQLTKRVMLH